jgi:hypothetical protein
MKGGTQKRAREYVDEEGEKDRETDWSGGARTSVLLQWSSVGDKMCERTYAKRE